MAFFGRGGLGTNGNNFGNGRLYRFGFFRVYYFVPLDNTYVIFQMIATFIILIVGGIAYLTTYDSPIIDPIEDTKNIIMNSHTIIVLALLIITLLVNHLSKDKRALVNRLLVILLITIITLIAFFGIKINMNSTYTNSKFEQIYEEEYKTEESKNKKRIDIGFTGVNIKEEKEYFIDECVKMYNIFNIKTYGIIIVNTLLVALLGYQINKVSKIQDKRDRLSRDDAILYDEEEDVKI